MKIERINGLTAFRFDNNPELGDAAGKLLWSLGLSYLHRNCVTDAQGEKRPWTIGPYQTNSWSEYAWRYRQYIMEGRWNSISYQSPSPPATTPVFPELLDFDGGLAPDYVGSPSWRGDIERKLRFLRERFANDPWLGGVFLCDEFLHEMRKYNPDNKTLLAKHRILVEQVCPLIRAHISGALILSNRFAVSTIFGDDSQYQFTDAQRKELWQHLTDNGVDVLCLNRYPSTIQAAKAFGPTMEQYADESGLPVLWAEVGNQPNAPCRRKLLLQGKFLAWLRGCYDPENRTGGHYPQSKDWKQHGMFYSWIIATALKHGACGVHWHSAEAHGIPKHLDGKPIYKAWGPNDPFLGTAHPEFLDRAEMVHESMRNHVEKVTGERPWGV